MRSVTVLMLLLLLVLVRVLEPASLGHAQS